jgi:hypothetical protein
MADMGRVVRTFVFILCGALQVVGRLVEQVLPHHIRYVLHVAGRRCQRCDARTGKACTEEVPAAYLLSESLVALRDPCN